ncbi:MAG TPA: dienelactone hydrolase family protein [Chloroflexota bacterium]|nr:dienelactone hydrolase family protein [Chloroflexota bacterium]
MEGRQQRKDVEQTIEIPIGAVTLAGTLTLPPAAHGMVIFAHGSGSSRHSPRNRAVARVLEQAGLGTLLMDLLTPAEEAQDRYTAHLRFDVGMLAERLAAATEWLARRPDARDLDAGYFGASTGAAAALIAADHPRRIHAVVSRGGRPDLAGEALSRVHAPTLLIVGENDPVVLRLNQEAAAHLRGERHLEIIPGATHLFEEPGALDQVALLARDWFTRYLRAPAPTPRLAAPGHAR